MSNYYLSKDYKHKHINDAGSKARMDIERTMNEMGFQPAGRCHTISKNRICHFIRTLAIVMRMPMCVKKGDLLVVQYPTKYYDTVCRLAHLRGANIVTFVHDLGCFRQKHNSVEKEIHRLNQSDALISCNPVIDKWLKDNGFVGYKKKGISEPLHVFDFFSDSQSPDRKKSWPMQQIVYAGQLALRKNRFLYDVGNHVVGYRINVYGKGFDNSSAARPEVFSTKGFMLPDKLISGAEGDFGLVWDGDSVDCCSGNWGEYLMVNTPHKVSLYIRCGLPIIIWRKAAMAQFIEENGIGICVDSLRDMASIYHNFTQEEYNRMCDNVQRVSRMMSEGYYFRRAITAVMARLNKS